MTDTTPFSKDELLARIQQGWIRFNLYLSTLSEEQLATPTDAAGWTAKDHIIHLAVWEEGICALLEHQSRWEAMGIDQETWRSHNDDRINAVIQQHYRDMPPDEVLQMFHNVHQRLMGKVHAMSNEELQHPYSYYQLSSKSDEPVLNSIAGDTFEHYAQHQPWIAAIVGEN